MSLSIFGMGLVYSRSFQLEKPRNNFYKIKNNKIFYTIFRKNGDFFGNMVFAKLKNFFAKLIFSRQIFFCSERFPFSKIPKKVLAGKKST
jgi:hypothetical protein